MNGREEGKREQDIGREREIYIHLLINTYDMPQMFTR